MNYSYIIPLSHLKEGCCYILIKTYNIDEEMDKFSTILFQEIQLNFIEIVETHNCIYKHPIVLISEFASDFLDPLLVKLSFKKGKLF